LKTGVLTKNNSFYLYSADPHKHHWPFLLVPTDQFVHFLQKINAALGISLTVPEIGDKYFTLALGRAGAPFPRYLGKVEDESSYASVVKDKKNLPPMGPEYDEWDRASAPVVEEYMELLDKVHNFGRGKPGARNKAKNKANANAKRRESMVACVLQAMGVVSSESFRYAPVDLAKPPPFFTNDKAPVLMCVDVEALELAPDSISEVGLTFLDLEQTKNIAPGEKGENWWEHMVSWHVRVREYSGLRNFKYVQGCPDDFDFG
jgi:hypothetical protein